MSLVDVEQSNWGKAREQQRKDNAVAMSKYITEFLTAVTKDYPNAVVAHEEGTAYVQVHLVGLPLVLGNLPGVCLYMDTGADITKSRVEISGRWPHYRLSDDSQGSVVTPRDVLKYKEANPYNSITAAFTRGGAAAWKDAKNRMLNGYLEVWDRCIERVVEAQRHQENAEKWGHQIANAFPQGKVRENMNARGQYYVWDMAGNSVDVRGWSQSSAVQFSAFSTTPERAIAILKILGADYNE